ncbi:2-octaprenyl-6-methoxyphenyl hydroxylase [Amphritea sp. HPY]|uniref:2-octaprenyl-6-methoxyphenyl hydroxylase n=1 Tax=Amphritea sp. HPY TaxID=3421652 RepID=UPI003D7CBBE6
MKKRYDVVIVGGGMVGASLAAALIPASNRLGLDIAVIEAFPMPAAGSLSYQPSYDSRATALAYGSRMIYQEMGIWDTLKTHLCPITDIHVSDKGQFGAARLKAADENVPALGYVVENQWLGRVLMDRIQQPEAKRIDLICPAEVTRVEYGSELMTLRLQSEGESHELTSQLVVMADGGRSQLRQQMGIGYRQQSYQQHAVIANISPEQDHRQVAYERFTDTGPMAFLPLEGEAGKHRMGLVWTVPDSQIDEVMGLSDEDFIERLQQRFGYRVGRILKVGERHSYPLQLSVADEQVRRGLVVLGNAAHALHPIAGQGYNLALRGAATLAETLIRAAERGESLGNLELLSAFHEQVRGDQQKTIGFSDQTMKLFSNPDPLLAFGRSAGLQLLDLCPMAKTVFARSAMGLDSPAPDLK